MIETNIYKINLLKTATSVVVEKKGNDLFAYAQGVAMVIIRDADDSDLKRIKEIVQRLYNGYGGLIDEKIKLPKKIRIRVVK